MVLIFSCKANDSPQVRREVERAISKGLAVLPFRVENVVPAGAMEYALGNTHWLDAFTPPADRQLDRLADAVHALLGRPLELPASVSPPTEVKRRPPPQRSPSAPPQPTPARKPVHRDDRASRLPAWALVTGTCAVLVCLAALVTTGLYLTGVIGRSARPGVPEDAGAGGTADSSVIVRDVTCTVVAPKAGTAVFLELTHQHPGRPIREVDVRVSLTQANPIEMLRGAGIDTSEFKLNVSPPAPTSGTNGATQPAPEPTWTTPPTTIVTAKNAEWPAGAALRIAIPQGEQLLFKAARVTGTGVVDGRSVRIEATVNLIDPNR